MYLTGLFYLIPSGAFPALPGIKNSPSWTRTNDTAVNSRMLYRLSYGGSFSSLFLSMYLQNCTHVTSFFSLPFLPDRSRSSPRPISNSQLHTLLHFHLCPIYLVVFKGSYFASNGISHLEGGFTLRCLQRLSLPDLATLPCSWHYNRYTRGQSIPVLSY